MILLFTTVKTKSDLLYYAAANIIAEGGGNIFNFIRLRKYVTWNQVSFRKLNCLRHLKPALKTFVLNISTSIYLHLDSVMLGFLGTHDAVGFYTASNSIVRPSMTIIISLGGVLFPRLSNLINNVQTKEFERLVKKTMHFGLLTSIPMAAGLIVLAHPIVQLFCGPNFESSVLTTQIMSPIIIAVTLSCFMLPILYACRLERIPLIATSIGALINMTLNFVFIPAYMEIGAAGATLIAEFFVMAYMLIYGKKYVHFGIEVHRIIIYILSTMVMSFCLILVLWYFRLSDVMALLCCIPLGAIIYFACLFLLKEKGWLRLICPRKYQ